MFQKTVPTNRASSAVNILELIYHNTVRSVRKAHGNAFMSIAVSVFQSLLFVLFFYIMFSIMGLKGLALRGDFVIFLLTGIFMFMTHNKAVGAVLGSEGPSSAMMQHAPMNTFISILSGMLSVLYIQVLAIILILFVYDIAMNPYVLTEIVDPAPVMGMLLLSWFSGGAVGMVFLALKPWLPGLTATLSNVYKRANMIASGKMFVANSLPSFMIALFDWNPLFHTIDQARGFAFINYVPRNTNWEYVVYLSLTLLMIGLMGEFYTRRHASASWSARR
ncbi:MULTISPECIES: ABC transporter permease [Marivita]|jgi:ABC-type polysaccharide/polyol phosphate export permease|uniref:ABC transporter permease n=1 Tax=Marivita cryptomonadis TaxID=505252 RepID=A0A9Q2NXH0_9RHOB|nr:MULTISPECIES: ABC transporter permease [Marivita]MCR9169766.1 ABC transporter permease [Paracoccaceae bacterium]MBM2321656.1 ABC transporter permease [Marivita cryptomonadis]MBM2331237.1 ABC transporter permease [Marivita cryptomonadis]MBM2340823.1 ABC transporter permease [Marivita cryptomonadis]MBM2345485.1 ABC transporter permease [Marivita cryptomonadis]